MTVYEFYKADIKIEAFEELTPADKVNEIQKAKPYVLIIDEINRGNVSQIFGELITLIEEDKRLGRAVALEVKLPYSKTSFGVPPNLYIIGTMNTADRSVEALDTALRRRFSFEEMPPLYDLEALKSPLFGFPAGEILRAINQRIELLLDKDHLIGHAYFLNKTDDTFITAFYKNIIPLLQEYFYGDYGKIGLVLGDGFVKKKQFDDKLFANFSSYGDTSAFTEREVYEIVDYRYESQSYSIEIDKKPVPMNFEKAIKRLMNANID
jgi:5-methylcytosine-specific restriction protein B